MALVTYGSVKSDLMLCVENGLSDPTDPRIMPQTNAAMRALARAMPRGVFVGSTAVLSVPVNSQGVFALPPGYDVAFTMESDTETTQLPSGWYDLLSRSTFVNPDELMGTAFYDLGQDPATGIRSYCAPHLPAGVSTLTVSALKAFAPVVDDTSLLYVQNVEAIKLYLLSFFMQRKANQRDMAKAYQQDAIQELTNELQRHIDDPSLYAARMAQWQYDAVNLPANTLGNVTARMALDFAAGQKIGRVSLYRVVNEASRQATEMYNDLGKTEQLSNNAGPEAIAFSIANNRTDVLSYPDYEVLALLVRAQGPGTLPEQIPVLKDQAQKIVARNLATKIEAARNVAWQALVASNPQPQFGGMWAQLGLEWDGGAEYPLSDRFVSRITRQAWAQAVDQFNLLSRTEDYEQTALPSPAAIPADTDVVPFPMEVIKLYWEAQICQDRNEADRANAYKQQGEALIQRNLVSLVERQRRTLAETQVLLPINTFGYTKGRLALELPDGLSMSDAKRGRLINESEELLADSGRWKYFEAEYTLQVASDGTVVVPPDVETIIAAEQCGRPIELKDRRWFYNGFCADFGDGRWFGWDLRANNSVGLIYAGKDDCDNTYYNLRSCHGGGLLRALCRRKWLPKYNDSDNLLIQNYPAVKSMCMSLIAKQAGDGGNAEYRKNSALAALDRQLGITQEGQVTMPSVDIPGLPLGGIRGRGGFVGNRY